MGKYDDMFNKHFNNDEFNGDPEKREMAMNSFNKMMESLNNIKITDEFISKYLDNLNINLSLDDEFNIINDEDGDGVLFPIYDDTDNIIRNNGMVFENINLKRSKGHFIATELWASPDKEILLKYKYILSIDIFETKDIEIQEVVVDKIIKTNYIKDDSNEFLNKLPIDTQKKYYNILLNKSIESESYEESAIYRDKINSLNNLK